MIEFQKIKAGECEAIEDGMYIATIYRAGSTWTVRDDGGPLSKGHRSLASAQAWVEENLTDNGEDDCHEE